MRVATFNVNSVRARAAALAEWLDRDEPDVVCLSETRCRPEQFPVGVLRDRGYEFVLADDPVAPSRNGVAIASRVGLRNPQREFPSEVPLHGWDHEWPVDEGRILRADAGPEGDPVSIVAVYAPNGRSVGHWHYKYKLAWLDALVGLVAARRSPLLVAGDVNVAPDDVDVSHPSIWRDRVLATGAERRRIEDLEAAGAVDLWRRAHPDPPPVDAEGFTWVGAMRGLALGLRLDVVLATDGLVDRCRAVRVDRASLAHRRPSDHLPLVVDLEG